MQVLKQLYNSSIKFYMWTLSLDMAEGHCSLIIIFHIFPDTKNTNHDITQITHFKLEILMTLWTQLIFVANNLRTQSPSLLSKHVITSFILLFYHLFQQYNVYCWCLMINPNISCKIHKYKVKAEAISIWLFDEQWHNLYQNK